MRINKTSVLQIHYKVFNKNIIVLFIFKQFYQTKLEIIKDKGKQLFTFFENKY